MGGWGGRQRCAGARRRTVQADVDMLCRLTSINTVGECRRARQANVDVQRRPASTYTTGGRRRTSQAGVNISKKRQSPPQRSSRLPNPQPRTKLLTYATDMQAKRCQRHTSTPFARLRVRRPLRLRVPFPSTAIERVDSRSGDGGFDKLVPDVAVVGETYSCLSMAR